MFKEISIVLLSLIFVGCEVSRPDYTTYNCGEVINFTTGGEGVVIRQGVGHNGDVWYIAYRDTLGVQHCDYFYGQQIKKQEKQSKPEYEHMIVPL